MATSPNKKLKAVYSWLKLEGLDGLLVTSDANISYITDYLSRDSWLLLSKKKNTFLTDSRYTQEAKNNLSSNFKVEQVNGKMFACLAKIAKSLKLRNLGFEDKHLSYATYQILREKAGNNTYLIPTRGCIESLREVKNLPEIEKIREATEITVKTLEFAQKIICPGKTELEIVGELERFIRYEGATDSSFDIIAASGPNSSYPHHKPSSRVIKKNEHVLIDIGVDYLGYKSDLTRVFFLGKINVLARKIYNIVLTAQRNAIAKIKPGIKISDIDLAAREYITKNNFGRFFGHNLGHGVGLEIHEAPNLSPIEDKKLKEGMIFTVEPAIYLPGKFGIRIEDMVLVTKKGCVVLSGSLNQ